LGIEIKNVTISRRFLNKFNSTREFKKKIKKVGDFCTDEISSPSMVLLFDNTYFFFGHALAIDGSRFASKRLKNFIKKGYTIAGVIEFGKILK